MNKALRVPDYLGHIADAIEKIFRYVNGLDWAEFSVNLLVQDATIRNLEIIGEAARNILRVDPGFTAKHPMLPLGRAIGMRNALSHGYFDVKLDEVWKTIKRDLPDLNGKVRELLLRMEDEATGEPKD